MSDLSTLLTSHRSIRKYKPTPINQALIEKVCAEAVAGASSSGNLNSISMILTRDAERRAALCKMHFDQPMVLEAPLVITFCADWFRTRQWLEMRGAKDNFNNFLGYHVAASDAMIIAQNVCLGFQAQGLGICYMGTTLSSMKEIGDFLGLPDTCVPVTSVVVGYPDENPAKRDRLPFSALLHDETYHEPSAEELEDIYRLREVRGWERYMAHPEIRKAIEERGIKSLAEYYTSEVKYDPDEFRQDSVRIRECLEAKHFLP